MKTEITKQESTIETSGNIFKSTSRGVKIVGNEPSIIKSWEKVFIPENESSK